MPAPTSQIFFEASDTVPLGKFIRSEPAVGEIMTDPSGVVKIYISSGPSSGGGTVFNRNQYNNGYQY
jgi:beta-lactam-binding protein with PASTA domain